jgi:diguanylate cyclase (GGDEF)-like protein
MVAAGKGLPAGVERTGTLAEGLTLLAKGSFGLVILDISSPDTAGIEGVAKAHAQAPGIPIIVLMGQDAEALSGPALRAGADDCLAEAELSPALLCRAIRYAINRQTLEAETRRQAFLDPVTGLYSRQAFLPLVQRDLKMARRRSEKVAMLAIHTGGLGRFCAAMGPQQGQHIFADFAQILRATFRETDLIARVGPDDFAVLALGLSPEGTDVVAERLRKCLLILTNHPDWLSIRVAALSPDVSSEVSAADLLTRALQAAKEPEPPETD